MDRVLLGGPGGGRFGKLTDDPAIDAAAAALLYGVADPLAMLALSPGDMRVMQAVLAKASKWRHEYDTHLADYTAGKVAEAVVPPLAKSMSKTIAAVAAAVAASRRGG